MHRRLQDHQASPRLRSSLLAMALLSLLGLASCTPYATFPPLNNVEPLLPGLYPVPQVMGKSLRTAYDKTSGTVLEGDEQPTLVFALPDGISAGNWRQIGVETGVEGAREITEEDYQNGVPFWSIEQVRIRNHRAEVDVIFPTADEYQRATVILESDPFTAFEVTFFQRWRIPVDVPAFTQPDGQASEAEQEDEEPAADSERAADSDSEAAADSEVTAD